MNPRSPLSGHKDDTRELGQSAGSSSSALHASSGGVRSHAHSASASSSRTQTHRSSPSDTSGWASNAGSSRTSSSRDDSHTSPSPSSNQSSVLDGYRATAQLQMHQMAAKSGKLDKAVGSVISYEPGNVVSECASALKVLIPILTDIHPAVGAICRVLKSLVELDLKRRENDKTVCDLLNIIRYLANDMHELRGSIEKGVAHRQFSPFGDEVALAISECEGLIREYIGSRTMTNIVRSSAKAQTLAEWVKSFQEYRQRLHEIVGVSTARMTTSSNRLLCEMAEDRKRQEAHFHNDDPELESMRFRCFHQKGTCIPAQEFLDNFLALYSDATLEDRADGALETDELTSFINPTYGAAIIEAVDFNRSGTVTFHELRTFASSRPKDLELLEWMVYRIAAMPLDIAKWSEQITQLLDRVSEDASPWINAFMSSEGAAVRKLLASVEKSSVSFEHPRLKRLAEKVRASQRRHLLPLEKLKNGALTAELAMRTCRVNLEMWFFPLLHLALERMWIFLRSSSQTECVTPRNSEVLSVLHCLEYRRELLQDTPEAPLSTFAFGMFSASIVSLPSPDPENSASTLDSPTAQSSIEDVSVPAPAATTLPMQDESPNPHISSKGRNDDEEVTASFVLTYYRKVASDDKKATFEKYKMTDKDIAKMVEDGDTGKSPTLIRFKKDHPHISNRHWRYDKDNMYIAPYMKSDIVRTGKYIMVYDPSRHFMLHSRGIRLGDIGFVDEDGVFHIVLNIFDGATDFKHFIPIEVASKHITGLKSEPSAVWYSSNLRREDDRFVADKPVSTAELLLVEDSYTCDLSDTFFTEDVVIAFFRLYTHLIYKRAKEMTRAPIRNGSLFLVRQCILASEWAHGSLIAPSAIAGIVIQHKGIELKCNSSYFTKCDGKTSGNLPDQAVALGVSSVRLDNPGWDTFFDKELMKDDPSSDFDNPTWRRAGWTTSIKRASIASARILKSPVQQMSRSLNSIAGKGRSSQTASSQAKVKYVLVVKE